MDFTFSVPSEGERQFAYLRKDGLTRSNKSLIRGLSGKWSDRISKVALTKTIKTPNSIFREPSAYIFRCNSLSESKLSFIDLQQTMSQSMLCFLKIQSGDIHEKATGL